MTAAKAIVAFIVAGLGFAAAHGISLPWYVEGTGLALIAGLSVYVTPNLPRNR